VTRPTVLSAENFCGTCERTGGNHAPYCAHFRPCERFRLSLYSSPGDLERCGCGGTREQHAAHRAKLREEAAEQAARPAPKTIDTFVVRCTSNADYWGKPPAEPVFYDRGEADEVCAKTTALGACPGDHWVDVKREVVA
jgi:hypothetical protein